jgi:hypothetical protein
MGWQLAGETEVLGEHPPHCSTWPTWYRPWTAVCHEVSILVSEWRNLWIARHFCRVPCGEDKHLWFYVGFEVFTAVTMKNVVFLDIKTQFVPHRRHITSSLRSSVRLMLCKIWGFHGGDYEECRLLEYKKPVRTSQETHYVSATQPSQLMLCKIWGFHGNDYEECRLLGYKNPVRTSQETHYVSATQSSQLMLCKIWGFHGNDYEECRLLGYKSPVRTP